MEVRNRFQGLDLTDRVPEELWMQVGDIVQEAVIKTIPKKKKCKKAKWLPEEALQIAEKRREGKRKGEKERYTHLNADFQRIARRDKKAFLSDQCKGIEENNRMGKTRDLFKKIRDTKVPGAGERHSTRDKGHEEGGSAYAKAGSSLRSPPGYSRTSTPPKNRVCLLDCFVLSPLTLLGAVPYHHLALSDKELTYSSN